MLATGLRLGGALGVTWADLDLAAGTVAVRRTIIRVQGKGLIASRVKSKASERGLIMPSWCVEMLRERRVRRGGFEGPVFPDSLGGWRDRSNRRPSVQSRTSGIRLRMGEDPHLSQDGGDPARWKRRERPHDRR